MTRIKWTANSGEWATYHDFTMDMVNHVAFFCQCIPQLVLVRFGHNEPCQNDYGRYELVTD